MTWHPITGDPHRAALDLGLSPGDGVGAVGKGLHRRASDRKVHRLTLVKTSALGVLGIDEAGVQRRARWHRVVAYELRGR